MTRSILFHFYNRCQKDLSVDRTENQSRHQHLPDNDRVQSAHQNRRGRIRHRRAWCRVRFFATLYDGHVIANTGNDSLATAHWPDPTFVLDYKVDLNIPTLSPRAYVALCSILFLFSSGWAPAPGVAISDMPDVHIRTLGEIISSEQCRRY